ncbi:MAG: hypothetical protein CTY38_01155 [Methylotenera sp.]|uniref:hypothetical protein n=1 Tax=Methylotenera sp. TaxID=2051956 RepID=UPI000D47A0C7|nr:hypothetical protein [Methylotenera sp.]PPC84684.1 MAG: hypothetical protein CTY38_01155 [Methylotenera sp.]
MPRYFHVTPLTNVQSILADGLIPQIGERSQLLGETKPSIYLFSSAEALEGACLNWLEDCFDDEAKLTLFAVDLPEDHVLQSTVGYEATVDSVIPVHYLSILSQDLMSETDLRSLLILSSPSQVKPIQYRG